MPDEKEANNYSMAAFKNLTSYLHETSKVLLSHHGPFCGDRDIPFEV